MRTYKVYIQVKATGSTKYYADVEANNKKEAMKAVEEMIALRMNYFNSRVIRLVAERKDA